MNQTRTKQSPNIQNSISSNKQISTKNSRPFFNPKQYIKPSLTQQQISEIKQTFDIFDTKSEGYIDPKQLIKSLQSVNYRLKQNTIYQYILDLAADGAGEITFQKFLTIMTTRITQNDSKQDMLQLFSLYDQDKCGYISIKNIRRLTKQFNMDLNETQIQKIIQVADYDKDGKVSQQEFYKFMTTKINN